MTSPVRPPHADQASFDNADRWIEDVHQGRGEEVVIALVGNKLDLAGERWFPLTQSGQRERWHREGPQPQRDVRGDQREDKARHRQPVRPAHRSHRRRRRRRGRHRHAAARGERYARLTRYAAPRWRAAREKQRRGEAGRRQEEVLRQGINCFNLLINTNRHLDALSVDDDRTVLVEFLAGDPHGLEGREGRQHGATDPD